jgi:long-chain acyl-CoA synthetase
MDEEGYFYIVDRKKDLIKVSGFQVWPNEVEKMINSHPKVAESAVGGVPDLAQGEKVIAWVIRKDEGLSAEEVIAWCRKEMAAYKIPFEVYFVDSLPKTGVGKVLRRELVKEYLMKVERG